MSPNFYGDDRSAGLGVFCGGVLRCGRRRCTHTQPPVLPAALSAISLQDLILKPAKDDAALPEKLLVFIPGANVPVSYYTTLMQSIQNQTNLRLWVVVPAMPQQKCIFVCPSYDCRSSLHLPTPSPPCYAQTGR